MKTYKRAIAFLIAAGVVGVAAVICFFFSLFGGIGLLAAAGLLLAAGLYDLRAISRAYQDQMRREAAAALSSTEASTEDEEADADADAADADLEDEEDD